MVRTQLTITHRQDSPGIDALLKRTGVELDLFTDLEKHMFVERGMRGGISMASTKRYARTNNPLVEGYDPSKPNKYIMYLDANNLYGWAMTKPLPIRDFEWKKEMPTEEQIMKKKKDAKCGWILEVDLEYPADLHKDNSAYPLAPEKIAVKEEWLSEYQKNLMKELELTHSKDKKLLLTLEVKKNYVTHYINLQFYLKQGMKQGKTMENLRNRVDIRLVRSDEEQKIRKLVASPLYVRHNIFTKDLVGIGMYKSSLLLNKPVYTGMTILEVSKLLIKILLQQDKKEIRWQV